MAAGSSLVFLILASFSARANAANFTIKNNCRFTVWPAAVPVGGGLQLNPGETWTVKVPADAGSGRIWGRTSCSFYHGRGRCATGDCAGVLSCRASGQPPATLAEFTVGGADDYYGISVIDGFNVPMEFSCATGAALRCSDAGCADAHHCPSDDTKTHGCHGNSNYRVIFCP
ncbi:hypothetical protein ACP70R_045566 [Stipagrostis hirtigluma subsp. patula]